jgi:hypothetical protein
LTLLFCKPQLAAVDEKLDARHFSCQSLTRLLLPQDVELVIVELRLPVASPNALKESTGSPPPEVDDSRKSPAKPDHPFQLRKHCLVQLACQGQHNSSPQQLA